MNKRVKILQIGLSYNPGGIENIVYSWFINKPENFIFDFINDDQKKLAYEDYFRNSGCEIFYVTHRYKNIVRYIKELYDVVKNGNYDYIHCHVMNVDNPWPIIIAKQLNIKIILHCHSLYSGCIPIKEKILLFETKLLTSKNDYLKLSCSKDSGLNMFKNNKFSIIKNGINFESFKYKEENRKKIRKLYSIDDNDILIGHVGRSSYEKNYPFILSSFSKLMNKNEKYKLMLIGNMNEDNQILKIIDDLGIRNNVILTGKINKTEEYYAAMDLYYMPSINEGISVSIIEAQASGLKCIISDSISKEVDISNQVIFIPLDEEIAIKTIEKQNIECNRMNVELNKEYDEINSTKSVFKYYLDNL